MTQYICLVQFSVAFKYELVVKEIASMRFREAFKLMLFIKQEEKIAYSPASRLSILNATFIRQAYASIRFHTHVVRQTVIGNIHSDTSSTKLLARVFVRKFA